MHEGTRPLAGRVALVTGATRGCGRGIAIELGAAGAAVVVTGRSVDGRPSEMARPETIQQTAALINDAGGTAIAIQVDHTSQEEVAKLAATIHETYGRLDVLVNDIWGSDSFAHFGVPFWQRPLGTGLRTLELAVTTHLITSWHMVPLLVRNGCGLVVEVTDAAEGHNGYRDDLFYDLAKHSVRRLGFGLSAELRHYGIAAVTVTPGFLRSEAMLDHFGVTEENWRDAIVQDSSFAASETPRYLGRGVAALAADKNVMAKTGQLFASWDLAEMYGHTDVTGHRPNWRRAFHDSLS
ncbi:NAD(P)-dependent dehydrogenase (short-subunit alcohol dehydrogenase family) [Kibdelosporangium banguiense]|uniref:NAD(P)-dependent dehydrogenase (Short-subunit alcohol dehydrogenase family) n=1 Tax=Kibdelosporangium banguiense TaxID=1365924 RepID=A0ABS4TZH6_9PSEU|nr:SDR family oxidoreductase [Kibdelosporangium banguiense]MBP2329393.1 NAD(P)-dependent dehydrogenase (short-subunit alcohol dehydrogenase family) [Kibdelosporangium banguiense]